MFKIPSDQRGVIPFILLLGIVGIIAIMVIANFAPLKDKFLTSLYPKDQSSAAEIYSNNPITKKVLLIIYDPVYSNGLKMHQVRGWGDPANLTNQLITALNQASGGYLTYQIAETSDRNEWPKKLDGFTYNENTYSSCMANTSTCHMPDDADYLKVWNDLNICNKVSTGAIDDVIIYGFPYSGFDEFAFKIPQDQMPYGTPTNYWIYQGRKKNIPDCNGKTVFAMGLSFERGAAEAIHSYGHRAESALTLTVGKGFWDGCSGLTDFDKFTCQKMNITANTPLLMAGCGDVHTPFNGTSGYDYSNQSQVQNLCASFSNYPYTTPALNTQNCNVWGCSGDSQFQYIKWWLSQFPRQEGKTPAGTLRNWWKYVADFDRGVAEAKAVTSSPSPSPSSSPPGRFVKVTYPNGGETLKVGESVKITWDSSDVDKCSVGYSFGVGSLNNIVSLIPNTGSYDWTVNIGNSSGTQVKVDLLCYKTGVGQASDQSDNFFAVIKPTPTPVPLVCTGLVQNGSFESPQVVNPVTNNLWILYGAASTSNYATTDNMSGWDPRVVGTGYQIEAHKALFGAAADGYQYVEVDQPGKVSLTQSIQTVPSQKYQIKFAYSPRPDFNGPQKLGVYWDGQLIGTVDGTTHGTRLNWQSKTFEVTATNTSSKLGFGALTDSQAGAGNLIDMVSVTPVSTSCPQVPDVSSLINGLIGFWKMDETSGSSIGDLLVTGKGTASGTNIATGKIGSARSFNGSTDYISIPSFRGVASGSQISFGAWFNPSKIDNTQNIILDASVVPNVAPVIRLEISGNNRINTLVGNGSGWCSGFINTVMGGPTLTPNTWYHAIAVWNGSALKLYLNGSEVASVSSACTLGALNALTIGRYVGAVGYEFPGLIDEAGIWNRALSVTEVSQLYNSGQGKQF